MKILIGLVLLLMVAGCATPGSSQMSAEQLKALSLEKDFTAVCSNIMGPWGTGRFVYANVDRGVVSNGSITVDPQCVVNMTNQVTVKPVPAAVVVTPPAVVVK